MWCEALQDWHGKMSEQQAPLMWAYIYILNGACITWAHVLRHSGRPWLQKDVPLFISTVLIALPFFLPEQEAPMRGVLALAASFYAIKTRETITESRFDKEPLWMKVAGVLATFSDVQERRPCAPWGPRRFKEIGNEAMKLMFHVGCYLLVLRLFDERKYIADWLIPALPFDTWSQLWNQYIRIAFGCIMGCLFAFFSLHVYGDTLSLIWVIVGFRFPPLMDSPEQSLSVREFWKRWDTVIQKLLMKNVFKPARAAQIPFTVAAALTFFASGLVHILPIVVSRGNDWHAASYMMTYFIIQFTVMIAEQPLRVQTWNPWVARVWTIIHLFGPSYFLVFPTLRIIGIEF